MIEKNVVAVGRHDAIKRESETETSVLMTTPSGKIFEF